MFVNIALPAGIFSYRVPSELEQSIEVGSLVKVPLKTRKLEGWVINISKKSAFEPEAYAKGASASGGHQPLAEHEVKEIISMVSSESLLEPQLIKLGEWMSKYYQCSLGLTLNSMVPPLGKRLTAPKEEVPILDISKERLPSMISTPLKNSKFSGVLIYGSQRRHIYLKALKETLRHGKGVIFLVPEILLTSGVFSWLQDQVTGLATLLHSKLRKEERWSEWLKIKHGIARVVVGTRSAIFAPVQSLGLIIIDEEQDLSYKSEETPKYLVRTVAAMRAKLESCLYMLGSATPSMESFYNAETKKLSLLRLTSSKKPPVIKVVDMRKETDPLFSDLLKRKLRYYINRDERVILFLNRRGFYSAIICEDCGYIPKCPNCDIPLTYYKTDVSFRCHYCGYKEKPFAYCPVCKGFNFSHRGAGTSRIESRFKLLFPDVKIFRLDLDVVSKKYLSHVFNSFEKNEFQVLLGTRLVAKPLINFPQVSLVGIISADSGINVPDFRASEYTFALLTRLTNNAKEAVLQTYNPDHHIFKHFVLHDYLGFYKSEKLLRKELNYPPYSHLVRIVIATKSAEQSQREAQKLAANLSKLGLNFLGPAPCALEKRRGKFRKHVLLKIDNPQSLSLLQYLPRDAVIDVDPVELT